MQHLWLIHHRCELCIGLPAALYNGPCFAPRELRTLKSARLSKAQHNPQHSAQCIAGQDWLLQSASTFCSHRSTNCLISLSRVLHPSNHNKNATGIAGSKMCNSVGFLMFSRSSSIAMPVQRSAAASSLLCSILFSWLELDPWRYNGRHDINVKKCQNMCKDLKRKSGQQEVCLCRTKRPSLARATVQCAVWSRGTCGKDVVSATLGWKKSNSLKHLQSVKCTMSNTVQHVRLRSAC